jgi:hypothetical protein
MWPVPLSWVDERVDQLPALVAADRLLVRERPCRRPGAGERAGRRPAVAVGVALEVGEHGADQRGAVDGGGIVRMVSPTKYCIPEPPAMPHGFRLTSSTHFVSRGLPSTASEKRSGHSHAPPTAFAGPKSLMCVQRLRSGEL